MGFNSLFPRHFFCCIIRLPLETRGVFFCPNVLKRGHVQQFIRFCQEAYQELKLSSWLTRQQMIGSTVVVLILTLILAAYISLIDRVLLFLAGILFRIG